MASRLAFANKLYKFKKLSLIDSEGAHLPEAYKKFYREWKETPPKAVHYMPHKAEWERNDDTGEVKRLENVPIPLLFPPESHEGIWGGEGVIKGFQKRNRLKRRVPHFWVPNLIETVVYSEVLDKHLSVTATNRTIDLIIEHHGFDNYLLQTKACDLQSGLALKLKREILLALYNKELYPEDPIKAKSVFDKYKHFLNEYSKEDIDWYGWTLDEALKRWDQLSYEEPIPLKLKLRKQLLAELTQAREQPSNSKEDEEEKQSWFRKINPFGKKTY